MENLQGRRMQDRAQEDTRVSLGSQVCLCEHFVSTARNQQHLFRPLASGQNLLALEAMHPMPAPFPRRVPASSSVASPHSLDSTGEKEGMHENPSVSLETGSNFCRHFQRRLAKA